MTPLDNIFYSESYTINKPVDYHWKNDIIMQKGGDIMYKQCRTEQSAQRQRQRPHDRNAAGIFWGETVEIV